MINMVSFACSFPAATTARRRAWATATSAFDVEVKVTGRRTVQRPCRDGAEAALMAEGAEEAGALAAGGMEADMEVAGKHSILHSTRHWYWMS